MRSRLIKGEFWSDEDLGELMVEVRLLFVGLWCASDRAGRTEDRPKRIKAAIFPYDDFSATMVDQWLTMLDGKFIRRYVVDGKPLIQIINFAKHQRIHQNEAKSVLPPPPPLADGKPLDTIGAPWCPEAEAEAEAEAAAEAVKVDPAVSSPPAAAKNPTPIRTSPPIEKNKSGMSKPNGAATNAVAGIFKPEAIVYIRRMLTDWLYTDAELAPEQRRLGAPDDAICLRILARLGGDSDEYLESFASFLREHRRRGTTAESIRTWAWFPEVLAAEITRRTEAAAQ